MSYTDNINGIPAQDTVLRQGIATLRNTVISNTIKPLTVDHNGVYTANPNNGTYGYSPVTVDTGVYTGATAPDNSLGKDGDYYYKLNDLKASISFNPSATQNSSTYRLGHTFYVDEPTVIYGFSGYYRRANDNIKFLLLDDQANIIYESTTMTSVGNVWNNLVIDVPISIEANKIYLVMMDMPSSYGCYVSRNSSNVWPNFNNIHIEKGVYKYQSSSYSYDNDNIYMATILVKNSYYNVSNEYVKNNNAWILLSSTDKITTTTLSVTANGTYNAPTGTAYSSVSVDVVDHSLPSGYTEIDYVECPSASSPCGFSLSLSDYTAEMYDIHECKVARIGTSQEAGFAGVQGRVEMCFMSTSLELWTGYSSNTPHAINLTDAQTTESDTPYIIRIMTNAPSEWISGYNIGYYRMDNYIFKGKIYSYKISRPSVTNDNVVLFEFIPCIRNSDNKVGMYDVINDTFYSSTTGTEFVAPSNS